MHLLHFLPPSFPHLPTFLSYLLPSPYHYCMYITQFFYHSSLDIQVHPFFLPPHFGVSKNKIPPPLSPFVFLYLLLLIKNTSRISSSSLYHPFFLFLCYPFIFPLPIIPSVFFLFLFFFLVRFSGTKRSIVFICLTVKKTFNCWAIVG